MHIVDFGAIIISDIQEPQGVQYCEVGINVEVIERYYLKLFPASFLKRISDGKEKFDLRIDLHSKEDDMLKNGWKHFDSLDEMNKVADIENQLKGVRNLLIKPEYSIHFE